MRDFCPNCNRTNGWKNDQIYTVMCLWKNHSPDISTGGEVLDVSQAYQTLLAPGWVLQLILCEWGRQEMFVSNWRRVSTLAYSTDQLEFGVKYKQWI